MTGHFKGDIEVFEQKTAGGNMEILSGTVLICKYFRRAGCRMQRYLRGHLFPALENGGRTADVPPREIDCGHEISSRSQA